MATQLAAGATGSGWDRPPVGIIGEEPPPSRQSGGPRCQDAVAASASSYRTGNRPHPSKPVHEPSRLAAPTTPSVASALLDRSASRSAGFQPRSAIHLYAVSHHQSG